MLQVPFVWWNELFPNNSIAGRKVTISNEIHGNGSWEDRIFIILYLLELIYEYFEIFWHWKCYFLFTITHNFFNLGNSKMNTWIYWLCNLSKCNPKTRVHKNMWKPKIVTLRNMNFCLVKSNQFGKVVHKTGLFKVVNFST